MTAPTYVGRTCPLCRTPIQPDSAVAVCSACGVPHHRACWEHHGRCTTPGCPGMAFDPAAESMPSTPEAALVSAEPAFAAPSPQPASVLPPPQPAQPMPGAHLPPQQTQTYPPPQQFIPPPAYPNQAFASPNQRTEYMYLEQNVLVIRKGLALPPICIATGTNLNLEHRQRNEIWVQGWLAFLILFGVVGIVIYFVVYFCTKQSGSFAFFINRDAEARHRWIVALDWLAFPVLFASSFVFFLNEGIFGDFAMGFGILMIFISIFGPAIAYLVFHKKYTVTKMEGEYIWLKFRNPSIAPALYHAFYSQWQQ